MQSLSGLKERLSCGRLAEVYHTMGDISSDMGNILSTMGDIVSTMGDVQHYGGYHDKCEGNFLSTLWVILSKVGVIFSTVDGIEYCGGYLEYDGGVQYQWEDIMIHVWGMFSTPTFIMISSTVGNIPTVLKIPPMALKIPSIVLSTHYTG